MIDQSQNALGIVAGLLEARTGQKLTADRLWRVGTALSGVMRQNNLETLDELVDRLGRPNQTALAQQVVEALLNNETYFFRDRAMFDQLTATVLPLLARRREGTRRLSIWSVGCSTGQETYSLAMLFAELPARWRGWTIDILGTDVSGNVVDRARAGIYTQFEVQRGLGIGQTIKWFEESEDGWRVVEGLRRRIRFQVHNILEPPPHPGQFDIVLCRNVLLYLNAEKRRAAFDRMASAMAPDGWLMLGAGETVIGQTKRLKSDPQARGLYRLTDGSESSDRRTGADRRSIARA